MELPSNAIRHQIQSNIPAIEIPRKYWKKKVTRVKPNIPLVDELCGH